ncbi:MAG: hypothetical protein WBD32_18665 [Acidobacteriaceae bacterium]
MKKVISGCVFLAASLVAAFAITPSANATTRYIAQTAGTFSGGKACSGQTTITPATFNGTTNSPGDVDYICGTITVAANTEAIVVNGSGTSGNPITIDFDSGAVLASPEWPVDGSGGAIDIGYNNYITINGNGGASGETQGIIEATANGDSGAACLSGSCTYHGDSNGIEASGGNSNITIEGLSIIDMYVTASGVPNGGGGTCTYVHGQITNWTVTNNLFHDVAWCVEFQYDSGVSNGITISNNQIYNVDHGIIFGGPAGGNTLENVNVYGNNIHDYSNWDTSADIWHHDGIHIWGYNDNGSDTITGINIYDNKFGGCVGNDVTAHIFVEQNSGKTTNVKIYNNSLIDTCNGQDGDGLLTTGVDGGYMIYNNTIMGTANDTCMGTSSSPNVTFVNNVVSGCGTLMYIASGGSFVSGGLHNNIYANCSGSNCFNYLGNFSADLSAWQSETGQDASPSSYVASANLTAAGVPQAGSAVIGAGANLTSLSITSLDSDIIGNPRPATGSWTVGAYTNTGAAPAAPTNLTGTVVTN